MKSTKLVSTFVFALTVLAATNLPIFAAMAEESSSAAPKPVIVLVHGAWADGSCWNHVIPLLEHQGFAVTAVQNSLSSYADDVITTKRVIDAQKGPVILVGHSYGGAVITGAAVGSSNVKMLVYVAGFAPDERESLGALLGGYPPTRLATSLVPGSPGFVYIDRSKFHDAFAGDVAAEEAKTMAATQRPLFWSIFEQPLGVPAWKTIPSWYIVARQDQAIPPDMERFMAKRMGATNIIEIDASHVPMISQPKIVAKFIADAAEAAR